MNVQVEKQFATADILTLTTGIVMGDNWHECAEFVMGHSLFCHEFASKRLWEQLRDMIYEQHPDLREAGNGEGINGDNWSEHLARFVAMFGESRTLVRGGVERTKSPIETLREVAPHIKPLVYVAPATDDN